MAENPIPSTQFEQILNIQFEQPSRKRQKSYGLTFVKSFWGGTYNTTDGYFSQRNKQWKENEDFAQGKVDHVSFMEKMGVDTKTNKAWHNLDWNLLKIVPRYVQSILGGFMQREEKPDVNAVDILSREFKAYEKQLAAFRMKNKQEIATMEAAGGVQLEDGFTPEDEDELELYYKLQYRLPEEMFFGKTIEEVFQNSGYEDLKRQCLGDVIKKNISATKIVRLPGKQRTLGNRMYVRRCKPDRMVYNVFESPVGKDVTVIGEAYPLAISDIRKYYPDIDEKDLFTLAQQSSKSKGVYNPLTWQESYIRDFNRPYDDFKISVFDFEVKVSDKDYYVQTTNQNGKEILIKKKGKPNPQNGETVEESKLNIYCGVWAIDTEIMLKWEVQSNMIRPYQNGIDCFFTYSIVCPDANGTLVPSLLERGISVVRQMVLCALKIQQMMLGMRPDGISVDISGLKDLDIGTGASLQPLEITRIYDQTGTMYWDSTDNTGTNGEGNPIPFQEIRNSGNVAQLNTLVQLYNFWLQRLNDEWGTNPDAMGQPIPARRSVGVNQQMVQAANQATEYVYDFFVELMEQNASKIAMMLWDIIIFEADDYKAMDGINQSLIEAQFDVNIDMIPTQENKQRLQQKIDIALEKGTISLGQAIRLENMDNIKDAELYLIKLEKKAQQDAQASQNANIQMNAQVQEQSLQSKAKADDAVNKGKAQYEALVNNAKLDKEGFNLIIQMVSDMQVESMKSGRPIPPQMQPVVDYVLQMAVKPVADQQQSPEQQAELQQEPQPQEMA